MSKKGLSITPAEYELLTGSKLHKELSKKNKYRNQKTIIGNIQFDSKKEAQRFAELLTLYNLRAITDLRLQERIALQGSYKSPAGELVRGIDYVADFTYISGSVKIIEDVKSDITAKNPTYIQKVKMLKNKIQSENLNWKFFENNKRG